MIKKVKIPKLTLELIGYVLTSTIIASFSGCFLYVMSSSLADKISSNGYYDTISVSTPEFSYWLQLICILASLVVFFTFFLLFVGQKISYILSITNAIQTLREGNLTYKIDPIGSDELTVLADTINSFSLALRNHSENEDRLKKEKEDLIRSLSHDIRTPLTAIISYSDFIKSKKYDSTDKLESYIETIQNKAYQIQDLTTLLLNPSHNKNQDNSIEDGKLMFEQFISEFVDSLEDNDFEVDVNQLGLVNFKSHFNVQDISRIFDNLYSNIIKYADPQVKIGLTIFIDDEKIVLIQSNSIRDRRNTCVESNGIGLKNISHLANSYNGSMNSMIMNKRFKIEITLPINL